MPNWGKNTFSRGTAPSPTFVGTVEVVWSNKNKSTMG